MKITLIVLLILASITILITGNWDYVTQVVLSNTTWGLYNRDFFENLLVEVHGGIIDLLVVGVILYWFDKRKSDNESKDKAKERLDNLRFYSGSDSSYRFYGALKHLLSLGVNSVSIPEGNLSNLKITDLTLVSSNLIAVNFSKSTLSRVEFKNCNLEACLFIDTKFDKISFKNVNLKRTKFINAQLNGMDFRKCTITDASFKNSELKSANFRGVDCSNVKFNGANLRSANFIGATNLKKEMILEAKNFEYVKLPDGVTI